MLSLILSLRYIGESIQITTLGVGVGQKEMGEGEGRKKYFSLPPTPPLPLMSHPTASTILEFSIVVTQTKTITHEEKTSGMLGT